MTSFGDFFAAMGLLVLVFAVVCLPLLLIVQIAIKQGSAKDSGPSAGSNDTADQQPRRAA